MISILKHIFRIFKNGVEALLYNVDGIKRSKTQSILFLVLIPLLMIILSILFQIKISNMVDILISSLSIFTALIFGILFIASEKLNQRIEDLKIDIDSSNKLNDEDKNYLIRYINFTRLFVKQVSFLILLSIVLIVLLVLHKLEMLYLFEILLSGLSVAIAYYFALYFFSTLSNLYTLLMDDIKRVEKKIKNR